MTATLHKDIVMPKLAIIHTAPVNIEPMNALAAEILSSYEVVNLMDDSILRHLRMGYGTYQIRA